MELIPNGTEVGGFGLGAQLTAFKMLCLPVVIMTSPYNKTCMQFAILINSALNDLSYHTKVSLSVPNGFSSRHAVVWKLSEKPRILHTCCSKKAHFDPAYILPIVVHV